jgi:hypothetical protein
MEAGAGSELGAGKKGEENCVGVWECVCGSAALAIVQCIWLWFDELEQDE